jgi:Rha family phage regulatory protein
MTKPNDSTSPANENSLMPIVSARGNVAVATSRDVARFFEKSHKEVMRDIRNLIEKEPEMVGGHFALIKLFSDLGGGVKREDAAYEMDRDGFALLAMGFNGVKALKFKVAYIAAFNAMEKQLNSSGFGTLTKLQTIAQALIWSQEEIAEKNALIAVLAPKAERLDRIAGAEGSICITDAAKLLQVRPKDLFDFMDQNGWTYRRRGADHRCAYQDKLASGDLVQKSFTIRQQDGSERFGEQVRITPSGLVKLSALLKPEMQLDLLTTEPTWN